MKKTVAIFILLIWFIFVIVDYLYINVIQNAVVKNHGTYEEIFGPLSYFQPLLIIVMSIALIINTLIVFKKK